MAYRRARAGTSVTVVARKAGTTSIAGLVSGQPAFSRDRRRLTRTRSWPLSIVVIAEVWKISCFVAAALAGLKRDKRRLTAPALGGG